MLKQNSVTVKRNHCFLVWGSKRIEVRFTKFRNWAEGMPGLEFEPQRFPKGGLYWNLKEDVACWRESYLESEDIG